MKAVGGVADTLGRDGEYWDPLWRCSVRLDPVESALLREPTVRRLAHIAHAGASSLVTTQTFSRLEHSLGLLTLAAHFSPTDRPARVAALVHDLGHLPFSHSLERLVDSWDHHRLTLERVHGLSPLLEGHGIDPGDVTAVLGGTRASVLENSVGALKLDHLDGLVRSSQAHGRTRIPPAQLLAATAVRDGAVQTDAAIAAELGRLSGLEARSQTSPDNLVTTAVLRHLVARLLDLNPGLEARLPAMSEPECWAALLSHPDTREDAMLLLHHPDSWTYSPHSFPGGIPGTVHRLYLTLPLVPDQPVEPVDTTGIPTPPFDYYAIPQHSR